MAFAFDFTDRGVRRWAATPGGGVEASVDADYVPSLYVAADPARLDALALRLARDPKVVGTGVERRFASLSADDREPVLRVDVERVGEVADVAREVRCLYERGTHPPGTFRLFDVDLEPGFRYCLDRGVDPTPGRELRTCRLDLPARGLSRRDLADLRIDGERATADGSDAEALRRVAETLAESDPDVLLLSHGDLLALLYERAAATGVEAFDLGRRPGWTELAGRGTHEGFERVVHSPARYTVPGRVVVDRSNSFLHGKTSMAGLLELVAHARKPVEEVARASIGTVLTAIESREARERDVLVPWEKWTPEAFKSVRDLHAADRGGFVFEPDVGVHDGVVEVDFSSLYPSIICRHNVSPETVDCDCHAGRADVPGLGYAVCDDRGFLPDVLRPLVDARERLKAGLRAAADPDARADLRARSDAIKWVLVSCFGYQGYRNAKFGRIECHEAINAFARETLLSAKERFEDAGWRVVHGIVDSLWVKPRVADPESVAAVCEAVTDAVGVPLEFERRYDWFALVPNRSTPDGARTRYFGTAGDGFKIRGIECRQRSTTEFVARAQRAMLRALDDDRRPAAAMEVLADRVAALGMGAVDPAALVVRRRASKRPEAYGRATRTVAALRRARSLGHERHPGQDVRFVVVDDDAVRGRERVRLPFEVDEPGTYDADFYAERLVRATESVVSPFGWTREDVRATLDDGRNASLGRYARAAGGRPARDYHRQ